MIIYFHSVHDNFQCLKSLFVLVAHIIYAVLLPYLLYHYIYGSFMFEKTLFVCGGPLWPRLWSFVLSAIICICFLGFTFLALWTVRIHNFMRCFQLYSFSWVVRPHKQNEFGPQNCMSTSLWLRILEPKAKIDKLLSLQMINFVLFVFPGSFFHWNCYTWISGLCVISDLIVHFVWALGTHRLLKSKLYIKECTTFPKEATDFISLITVDLRFLFAFCL